MEHFAFAMFAEDVGLNGSRAHPKRLAKVDPKPQAIEARSRAKYIDAWRQVANHIG